MTDALPQPCPDQVALRSHRRETRGSAALGKRTGEGRVDPQVLAAPHGPGLSHGLGAVAS